MTRSLAFFVTLGLVLGAGQLARAECDSPAAKALRADAERATLWNWGWGALFAGSIVAHSGLALLTDDEDRKVALWTGAVKSSLGTINQMIFPIKIYQPKGSCEELGPQLARAREIERKKRSWLAHATTVGVNIAAFSFVYYKTDDLLLAGTGAILGSAVGELTIFTTPSRVRDGGFGLHSLRILPSLGSEQSTLVLAGQF